MAPWVYYCLVVLLLMSNVSGFLLNIVAMPGNWLIVIGTATLCWCTQTMTGYGISWYVIGLLLCLAVLGEVVELVAGTASAAKSGATRTAMVFSAVGSVSGSILGVVVGLPIPLVGSAIAALVGGAVGGAAGAVFGEQIKGRELDGSLQVGVAAFWGRVLGTAGKTIIGAIMLVIATIDSFW